MGKTIYRHSSASIAFVNVDIGYAVAPLATIATAGIVHTSGNLLVAIVSTAREASTVTGIADTALNTYTYITRVQGTNLLEIWYAKSITGNATNIVTATFSDDSTYRNIHVLQYSGCHTTSPLDQYETGTGTGTSLATGAKTTTVANEVIVSGFYIDDFKNFTAGSGFTIRDGTTGVLASCEDKIVSSIDSYSGSATVNTSLAWEAIMATFKSV
jgi:hypothetical protein